MVILFTMFTAPHVKIKQNVKSNFISSSSIFFHDAALCCKIITYVTYENKEYKILTEALKKK